MDSIGLYDSIDVTVDGKGLLMSRYESYKGKDSFNMVIINRAEMEHLAKLIEEALLSDEDYKQHMESTDPAPDSNGTEA